jgi:hypothetical protein
MPSLSEAIANSKKLSSYTPVVSAPPVQSTVPQAQGPSTNLRFILPAFNSDPDTLRQFDNMSTSTKIRILPRPQPRGLTTGITTGKITSGTVVTSTSGGSSSSSSGGSGGSGGGGGSSVDNILLTMTAAITTGALPLGTVLQTSTQMAQSGQLISMFTNGPCEVRLYGTQTAQAFDASRPSGNPIPPEISQNVITCVIIDTAPFVWGWQSRMFTNQDSPQTATIYCTVIGTNSLSGAPVTVTITYVPLEGTNV